jgi:HK97 family phage prohead protease
MTLKYQHRQVPVSQYRSLSEHQFAAVVMTYGTVDDYETTFLPGVFNESMKARMPRVVWAHDWSEPLGRYISYEDDKNGLTLIGEFDDFDAVPRARQAHHQLGSGTIDQFSVGFMPEEVTQVDMPLGKKGQTKSVMAFVRGRLDEASLVLVGAVPGTELLSVRIGQHPGRPHILVQARQNVVDVDLAAGVLLDLQTGKVDIADALMTLKNSATAAPTAPTDETDETDPPPAEEETTTPETEGADGAPADEETETETADDDGKTPAADDDIDPALQAEIDAALALVGELA